MYLCHHIITLGIIIKNYGRKNYDRSKHKFRMNYGYRGYREWLIRLYKQSILVRCFIWNLLKIKVIYIILHISFYYQYLKHLFAYLLIFVFRVIFIFEIFFQPNTN